ncbi:putative bifunctional diguanylate cyclase/phosphodiesterase [Zwartia sp.]|uniref:putative bifunctional diguanylate cyclase/phosphodiesterase n=1 Tax=Zwartia sp. TaxID=2978004 RepID=UPI003BAF5F60
MNKLKAANAAEKLAKKAPSVATVSPTATPEVQELILMQQALNSISQGVLITDSQRRTTYINDAFEKMTGYARSEIMGGSVAILQGAGTNPDTINALRTALNAGQPFHDEILNYHKNGTPFWNELSINPVRNGEGNLVQFVSVQRDVSERKSSAEKIEHLAFYDQLTDLPNRRLLMDRLNHAFTSSKRSGREGAVLFIDADNFKDVNDTLGHDIGDLLIQQIAKRLESCMRAGDTIARTGGDEFVVVLEDLSEQRIEAAKQVSAIGEKILITLNQIYQLDIHEYRGTCSIGAVLFWDHEHSAEELLKRADIALFRSKNAGRNALTFFNHEMQVAIQERVTLVREMHTALDHQQFLLYYQVQVDSTHRTLGAEALIRWLHPERGLLSPAQFIPLAEELGLILPIGRWVLESACSQLKAWEKGVLTRDLVLSVNVSAKEFHQVDFAAQIKALLQRYDINPALLKLELTESMLLDSTEDVITLMNTLKEIGVKFCLDDFGTGYSSLHYLKRLPIDQLKIDQSFVRDIVTDRSDKVIVRTIVVMAQSLDIRVIAEGVETVEQYQHLLDSGCNEYQGYLFGKPMPIEQFEELLK